MMMIRGVLLCQYNDRNTRHPIFLFSFYKHKTTPIWLRKKKKTLETIANEGDLAPFNDYSENVEYYRIYLLFSHTDTFIPCPTLEWPQTWHRNYPGRRNFTRSLFPIRKLAGFFSLCRLFSVRLHGVESEWPTANVPLPFPSDWWLLIRSFHPEKIEKKRIPGEKKKGKNIHGRKNLVFFDIFLRDRYAMLFKDHSKKLQALDGASSVPSIDVCFFPRSSQRHFKIPQTTTSIDHILRWS